MQSKIFGPCGIIPPTQPEQTSCSIKLHGMSTDINCFNYRVYRDSYYKKAQIYAKQYDENEALLRAEIEAFKDACKEGKSEDELKRSIVNEHY